MKASTSCQPALLTCYETQGQYNYREYYTYSSGENNILRTTNVLFIIWSEVGTSQKPKRRQIKLG